MIMRLYTWLNNHVKVLISRKSNYLVNDVDEVVPGVICANKICRLFDALQFMSTNIIHNYVKTVDPLNSKVWEPTYTLGV